MSQAEKLGVPLVRLRKLVVFDRLMARLLVAAPNRWVLKGAVAIHFRVGPRFRTTKDMDLGRQDNDAAATADFLAAQAVDLGDYFTFIIERGRRPNPAVEDVAVRYHVTAEIAGRPFEDVTVDIGFSDPVLAAPEMLRGPNLLDFAEIPPAEVPVLPLEQHLSEKVHALTRSYAGSQSSSRVKDLIDLVAMATFFGFHAGTLRRALEVTFADRGTHPLPSALLLPSAQWRIAYRRMAAEVGLDADMTAGYQRAKAFLEPVLTGAAPGDARWDSIRQAWNRKVIS